MEPIKCKECGREIGTRIARRQPGPLRSKLVYLAGALGLAGIGVLTYLTIVDGGHRKRMESLAMCAQFRGAATDVDTQFLLQRIDQMTASGLSWDQAYSNLAAFTGCSP